jgi:hypothetical protein
MIPNASLLQGIFLSLYNDEDGYYVPTRFDEISNYAKAPLSLQYEIITNIHIYLYATTKLIRYIQLINTLNRINI